MIGGMRHEAGLPEAEADAVGIRARALARGLPFRDYPQFVAEAEALDLRQIRERCAQLRDTAALFVPLDVVAFEPGEGPTRRSWCEQVEAPLPGRTYRPGRLARLRHRQARQLSLAIGADGVSLVDTDGDVHAIRWADVLEIRQDRDDKAAHFVVGLNGCSIVVDSDVFGDAAVADLYRTSGAPRPA